MVSWMVALFREAFIYTIYIYIQLIINYMTYLTYLLKLLHSPPATSPTRDEGWHLQADASG